MIIEYLFSLWPTIVREFLGHRSLVARSWLIAIFAMTGLSISILAILSIISFSDQAKDRELMLEIRNIIQTQHISSSGTEPKILSSEVTKIPRIEDEIKNIANALNKLPNTNISPSRVLEVAISVANSLAQAGVASSSFPKEFADGFINELGHAAVRTIEGSLISLGSFLYDKIFPAASSIAAELGPKVEALSGKMGGMKVTITKLQTSINAIQAMTHKLPTTIAQDFVAVQDRLAVLERLIQQTHPISEDGSFAKNRVVYFSLGNSSGPNVDKSLNDIAQDLKQTLIDSKCSISVSGYADSTGSDSSNKSLALKRAEYVAAYLRNEGISVPSSSVRGWGERRLEKLTDDDVQEQENRRAVIYVSCASDAVNTKIKN